MNTRKVLFGCGIASSLLYVAMNVIGPLQYPGYSVLSQSVSELSAIGAPSRHLWIRLGFVYDVLIIAFGLSVWWSAGHNRPLRVVGGLLAASGALGFVWAPMHIRGEGFSLTDTLHIVVSAVWVLLSLTSLGFGAAAFGRRFAMYSIASLVVQLALGTWVGMQGPEVAANRPTPWLGVVQRINIALFMLWVAVLAVRLMRAEGAAAAGVSPRGAPRVRAARAAGAGGSRR